VAQEVNAHLPEGERLTERSVHAVLSAESEHFAWVGTRGTFGLTEWGLQDLPKRGRSITGLQVRAMMAALTQLGRAASAGQIVAAANPKLAREHRLDSATARTVLDSERARFTSMTDGTYTFRQWKGTPQEQELGSLGRRTPSAFPLERAIAQILYDAGVPLTLLEIAEQAPILCPEADRAVVEAALAAGRRFRHLEDGRYALA
jgi:hypothetical protein